MGWATEQREALPAGAPGPCEPALQRPVTAAPLTVGTDICGATVVE